MSSESVQMFYEFSKLLFKAVCDKYKKRPNDNFYLTYLIEICSFKNLRVPFYLVDEFFGSSLITDDEFTIIALNNIIDLEEWDKKFAQLLSEPTYFSDESFIKFLTDFIQKSIVNKGILNTYDIWHIYT